MSSESCENSNYPDWPKSFKGYYHDEELELEISGNSVPLPDLSGGPDPDEVKDWKMNNNASVTQVCEHFELSRMQVIKVVGE